MSRIPLLAAYAICAWLAPLALHAQVAARTSTDSAESFHGRTPAEWAPVAVLNPSVRVRAVARLALSRMGASAGEAVPILTAHLNSSEADHRIAAAWALSEVGELAAPAVPALALMTRDSVPRASAFALVALRAIGPRYAASALPAVRRVLSSPVPGLRDEAIATLVALDSVAAVPDLVGMLGDSVSWVRVAALEALRSVGPPARAAIPTILPFVTGPHSGEASAAVKALERIIGDPPGRLTHIPLMAEIEDGGHELMSDGRGAFVNGVDGVNVVVPLALNLMAYCPPTEECDTHTKNFPMRGPEIRSLRFDLTHPVQGSGAVALGIVVDHEGIMRVFWKREGTPPRPVTIQAMPVSDALQTVERVQFEIEIDGTPHVLQFGPWGMGQFNVFGAVIGGEGTSTASVLRSSPHEWIVTAPSGSVGRLWDISDPDRPSDRGLYHFSFRVRFAQLAPHLFGS